MSDNSKENLRQIKSYVQRAGRVTKKQQQALDDYASKYMIEYDQNKSLDFSEIFKNSNDVVLEIGFGMGGSLVQMALENPTKNYLGIEVHKAGVGNILYEIEHQNISNLLVMSHDAVEILENMISDSSLSGMQIYFPDPWHKKKHNKRRLVNQSNVDLFAKKLKVGGVFHYASDWLPYAEEVLELLENDNKYKNLYDGFAPRPEWRPLTKFEKRGQNLDHSISDILFEKI
ncbi:tRNA (guanosine(46)-N7)-methyltransferase TrmB [Francisella noatunensis]|uniref:tRNA (guanine-N(7)-)-methyltransferase n=1 Tax=Francisella noatunensis TaxID=657445 RepID=A0A9Q2KQR5_9GAMM|nr:tRNA (guanosine(46)-N7)-methyltransferase TrmB [Francisella noatunensis]MBK2029490.1 tRNA (guanosine(46)-N7)-methyltransferase TrmB [Francisella noatunensis]MBK2033452.1 tRNA (guanosine(46)-N7)-methyltransferase TrmB [Francisella noatunensis]MBK2048621.1 tRNA (guanosine(46)-N7)-methyltransferase TrmB [Francisella noatunensis]MBK2049771.1 tRNA (guanosine(46)-N7)-methyltransferase TrmB [Francisella noatunensis]MBK2051403.1 tRNA (guanosine(46)-N7)-methyltransferase TrmB [Francisella noatunensi